MTTTRKLIAYLIVVLGLTGLGGIGFSFFNQLACEGQLVNVNYSPSEAQQIWGDQFIGQSFVAPYDQLNRVDVMFQTYGRQNTHDVILRLLELPAGSANPTDGTEIFNTTFNASTVTDQEWRTFTFPGISGSAGKKYLLVLQSPTSTPGNAITIGGIDKDIYPAGTAYLGPMQTPADITFRACFQLGPQEKLQLLADQITRDRPGWWGDGAFYLFWVVGYSLLLLVFFWQLGRFMLN